VREIPRRQLLTAGIAGVGAAALISESAEADTAFTSFAFSGGFLLDNASGFLLDTVNPGNGKIFAR